MGATHGKSRTCGSRGRSKTRAPKPCRSTINTGMKSRYYITVAWITVIGTFTFLMGWDPQIAIAVFGFGFILLIPLFVFTIILNITAVTKFWKSIRLRSLIPLGLFVLSFWIFPPIGKMGLRMRIERFKENIPEYERLAAVAMRNDITEMEQLGFKIFTNHSPRFVSIDLPKHLNKLAWGIRVRKDPGDNVGTVIFVYAGGFGHHYADYIYRSDGNLSNALEKLGFYIQAPINTNWCAAGR